MPDQARGSRNPRGPREPLSRRRVLTAAIELADGEGLDAVTMRHLAERLDVVPMALYKHIADKEDLLDGMVDTLIEQMALDTRHRPSQWRHGIEAMLEQARQVVSRHLWARRAIETRTLRTATVLARMERVSQVFLEAGFSPDLTHHVMHLLGNRIWGFSPELFTGGPQSSPESSARRSTGPTPIPGDYPGILAIAADSHARRPAADGCDEDVEFAFALDVILEGVARLRRARWSSG